MKSNLVFVLTFMLSVPLLSLAAATNSKKVDINSPMMVAHKQLKPGTYKVEWNGNGPSVQVAFLRNNKEVVTAPAKVVTESASTGPAQKPAVETHKNAQHANVLDKIDFKNMGLKFHSTATGA